MEVTVVKNRVRPAEVAKLQGDIARQKQDALSTKLLSDVIIEKLQKDLARLEERVTQLEQPLI